MACPYDSVGFSALLLLLDFWSVQDICKRSENKQYLKNLSIELKHNTSAMKVPNFGSKKCPNFHLNSETPIKVPNSKSWIGSTAKVAQQQ